MYGHSSPWLYRFIFAVLAGCLFAWGDWIAGAVTLVIALVLSAAWMKYGDQYRRDSGGGLF